MNAVERITAPVGKHLQKALRIGVALAGDVVIEHQANPPALHGAGKNKFKRLALLQNDCAVFAAYRPLNPFPKPGKPVLSYIRR